MGGGVPPCATMEALPLQTRYMSQISQLSKLAISITVTVAVTLSPPSLPQLPPVPQQSNHMFCHIILWLVGVVPFSTNRNMFFCLQTLPACGHFCDKSPFCHFFLHQTQSKRDGNVRKKALWTLFIVNQVPLRPSTQEVGRGGGLAASYTRTSTDSNSSLLSSHIWITSDLGFLRCVKGVGTAVIGSGVQWLALVCTWLWWLWLIMLVEFVKHLLNNLLIVSL